MEIFLRKTTFSFHPQEFLYISCLWIFNLIICILLLNLQVWYLRRFICSLVYLFIYFEWNYLRFYVVINIRLLMRNRIFFTWYFKKLHIVCWLLFVCYVWITKSDLSKFKAIFNFTRHRIREEGGEVKTFAASDFCFYFETEIFLQLNDIYFPYHVKSFRAMSNSDTFSRA